MVFLSVGLGYAISCQFVSKLVNHFSNRRILILGLLLVGVATSFYGPSDIIGMPGSIYLSASFLFIAGLTSAMSILPVIPEMIDESYKDKNISKNLKTQEQKSILNDHISGLFNFFFAFGNTIGPLLGNTMYVIFG